MRAVSVVYQTWRKLKGKPLRNFEAKIKEKNRLLMTTRKMEEIQKQTEEDTNHEILTLKNTYERDLKKQIDANMKLRGELGIFALDCVT